MKDKSHGSRHGDRFSAATPSRGRSMYVDRRPASNPENDRIADRSTESNPAGEGRTARPRQTAAGAPNKSGAVPARSLVRFSPPVSPPQRLAGVVVSQLSPVPPNALQRILGGPKPIEVRRVGRPPFRRLRSSWWWVPSSFAVRGWWWWLPVASCRCPVVVVSGGDRVSGSPLMPLWDR